MKKNIFIINIVILILLLLIGCNKKQTDGTEITEDIKTPLITEEPVLTDEPTENTKPTEETVPVEPTEPSIPTEEETIPVEPTPEEIYYTITLVFDEAQGSVSVDKEKALLGEKITIEVEIKKGFLLEAIYLNDDEIFETSFIMPEGDVIINVTFKAVDPSECNHEYFSGICDVCGSLKQYSVLYELFGYDIDIYTTSERNPYGINLKKYGSDVSAYIYEPNLSVVEDPYSNIQKEEFYENYTPATSYEDAYYRSKHYLMSGDITPQYYLPADGKIEEEDQTVKITSGTYILDPDGKYLGYVVNNIKGNDYIIYYGGAYTSLNDVAAYLLAFGEVPVNTISKKSSSGQSQAISLWGKYGRVNDSRFFGDVTKYVYEPELPNILGSNGILYHEMDFGTTGGYSNSNSNGTNYRQTEYNTGSKISRGAARMVYVADTSVTKIEERHVFYTYNHYNDFQEYLNYYDGWGIRFGCESAGNEYCNGNDDFYAMNCVPPTKYPEVLFKKYNEV